MREGGFSLVELLVALLLGAFIVGGLVEMFTANRLMYEMTTGQARLQENARFAMHFLERPIRMAGFNGCAAGNGADILNVLNEVDGETPYEFDLSVPLAGMRAGPGGAGLAALPDDIDAGAIIAGTDVLVVRSVGSSDVRLAAAMPSNSAVIKTTMPADPSAFADGAVLLICDFKKAAIFQSTNTTSTAGGTRLSIVHNSGASETPGNSQKQLTADGTSFSSDARVFAVETQIFYVAPGTGTDNLGGAPLSLWRKLGGSPPAELVEGVEDLQTLYGIDVNGDRVPNRYGTINTVGASDSIVSVRLSITATSVNAVTGGEFGGDGLLRRTFTKTITLRNRV